MGVPMYHLDAPLDLTATLARIAALEAAQVGLLYGTEGSATLVANLGIGATFDLTVTFARALTTTDYSAFTSIEGPAGLLGVFAAQVKTKTMTNCVVSLKNTGLVSIGQSAVVRVVAII